MSEDIEGGDVVVQAKAKGAAKMAQIVYILYLASIIFGVTGIIGLIMAYVNKGDSPDWLQTHYQFQIRTFWIGILIAIIGGITSAFGVGLIILLGLLVWYIMRCVKGMKYLGQSEVVPDPKTWIW
mgnify:CR=1 FL=1